VFDEEAIVAIERPAHIGQRALFRAARRLIFCAGPAQTPFRAGVVARY
jgi:hypothetical protein